jgi:hypothetical protein
MVSWWSFVRNKAFCSNDVEWVVPTCFLSTTAPSFAISQAEASTNEAAACCMVLIVMRTVYCGLGEHRQGDNLTKVSSYNAIATQLSRTNSR